MKWEIVIAFRYTPLTPAKLVMSEPNDVLDLVNPPQFDSDKWIGKGHTYPAKPEDVPMELSLYCDHLLEIPDCVRKDAFPDASFTVEKFLQLKLLESSYSVVHIQAEQCFQKPISNEDPVCLLI
jgi:hypothetical protein